MIVTALMVNWDTEVPANTKVSSFQVTRPALARLARETLVIQPADGLKQGN